MTLSSSSLPKRRTSMRKVALLVATVMSLGAVSPALALEEVVFGTNWLAQAEHGGFYQSVADGTYEACGLDVSIVTGGPQVNNKALMLAGRIDFHMGGDLLSTFLAAEQGIPVVAVAASFQKHPQVIIAHPGAAEAWDDLKDLTLLIGDNGFAGYYRWMVAAHGFTDEQRQPYTFNPAPFLADTGTAMQGYLSSEPYVIETEAGFTPEVFLIADAGFATYSTIIETMADTIAERPEVVECFVEGSILGWYNYLYGDNAEANAMIMADNAEMTQDKIDFAIEKMLEFGIVDSGEALEFGIGAMTDETINAFYAQMVDAGVIDAGLDYTAAYTTDFVNQGLGMDLRPE
ncbi:MAG: ABC transporter substrate-binding protein [Hyphomicrobiales bacterium]